MSLLVTAILLTCLLQPECGPFYGRVLRSKSFTKIQKEMLSITLLYAGSYVVVLKLLAMYPFIIIRLFYVNITFRHLFIKIKCPAELNFDCMILIRSGPSTGVTYLSSLVKQNSSHVRQKP